jgi:hypothetical protein
MQFYKYWTSAESSVADGEETITRRAFGYSNVGIDEALRVARERAERAAGAWLKRKSNRNQPRGEQYYGTDRAIREEIIEEFQEGDQTVAVVTRNSYGCLILNTSEVFFADVDRPTRRYPSLVARLLSRNSFFKKWFPEPLDFEQQLIEKIQALVGRQRELGLRLYRTAGGYRIVVTSRTIRAGDSQAESLLSELGADRLYVCLCRTQDCYRARLSPKHWRCDLSKPPARFPFATQEAAGRYAHWLAEYESQSASYATCVLIGDFGDSRLHPRVASILQLHDHFSIQEGLDLA